jgi:D-alanyl-lipoteichoic acid acyltransferase DltB (MBOAT superfamily)
LLQILNVCFKNHSTKDDWRDWNVSFQMLFHGLEYIFERIVIYFGSFR